MIVLHTYQHHHDPDPPTSDGDDSPADAAALAALTAGIADEPLPDLPPTAEPKADDPPAPDPDEPPAEADPFADPAPAETAEQKAAREQAEALKSETPEAKAAREAAEKKAADDAAAAAADPEAAAAKAAEAARQAEVEKEITGLGLKEKAAERFRELSATKAEYEPYRAAMATAGIKNPEQLTAMVEDARAGYDMVQTVTRTGATPEQYTMTLDYLAAITRAAGGDKKAAEVALGWVLEEAKFLSGIVGRELPGVFDPLEGHADLQADLDNDRITRERAIEVASARNAEKRNADAAAAATADQRRQTEAATARDEAIKAGKTALNELGTTLKTADPARFDAKKLGLAALVKSIAAKHPPAEWAQRVSVGYLSLPDDPKAPTGNPATPQAGGPLRPAGPTPGLIPQFDDPMAALNAGIDSADRGE